MSDETIDSTTLPIRRPPFTGVTAKTLAGSTPGWELIGHVEPPEGAPNVLVVLIDDADFGNPSAFGGPIETPNYHRIADQGLRYNRFHVTAMCSPTRASLLRGRNHHAVGMGGIPEFSGGFPGYAAMLPGSGGVIAVYDTDGARAVDEALANAVRKSIAHIDGASAKDLKAGLAEAQAGMGG